MFRSSYFKGLALVLMSVIAMNGCEAIWSFSSTSTVPEGALKTLKVAIVNHPLSFNKQGKMGLERDMIERFALDAGYQLQWKPVLSQTEAIEAVKRGSADVAAGRLNTNLSYETQLLASPAYEESPLVLVCPRVPGKKESSLFKKLFSNDKNVPPRIHRVLVKKFDLFADWNQRFQKNYPTLKFVAMEKKQGKDLLKAIAKSKKSCALVEKIDAQFYLRFFPTLRMVQEQTPPMSIGYLISPNRPEVQSLMYSWFQRVSRTKELVRIRDRYTGHLAILDEWDQLRFFRIFKEKFSDLETKFKYAAQEFSIPWQLVAAVAYQESQWNNDAVSFTGVRGIMMLTEETALHVGISDRTDLSQSIWGGAKYLKLLLDMQPEFLPPLERLTLALATYNVGPAHMMDAQRLAVRLGRNPYSWSDLRKVLPLLSEPSIYETLEYGEARGQEPVDFTDRILGFYELLTIQI
jgi:membrane-bound lytic murein transglycosylase F